jgi:hypothetical protein
MTSEKNVSNVLVAERDEVATEDIKMSIIVDLEEDDPVWLMMYIVPSDDEDEDEDGRDHLMGPPFSLAAVVDGVVADSKEYKPDELITIEKVLRESADKVAVARKKAK